MSQPKILSVDDSRMIHTLINKAFAAHDVQMVFASNGAEGLEVAEREKPDVILLDVTMPVMDGIECLTKLKATPALKDLPNPFKGKNNLDIHPTRAAAIGSF